MELNCCFKMAAVCFFFSLSVSCDLLLCLTAHYIGDDDGPSLQTTLAVFVTHSSTS